MEHRNLLGEPPATYLLPDTEADAAVAAGEAPEKIAARFPAYSAAWASLAVRADRLPPRPGPAAAGGLEGPRPGAVGTRAEPRLPPRPVHAGRLSRGDRRGRRGGALRAVPAGQQPHRRRGAEYRPAVIVCRRASSLAPNCT